MIIAILQARASSTRLPGKVLAPILGRPMLAYQIERVSRARAFDRLIVATSDQPEDNPIAALSEELDIHCFRGSLTDVLDRFYRAARPHHPEHVIRLTGDCPLADWTLIDRVTESAVAGEFDYCSNALQPTWPDGLDVEVVTFGALETAWREALRPFEREHVMPFIYDNPQRFRIGEVKNDRNLSHLRWTVDEPSDLEFVQRVYETLYPGNPAFTTDDLLALLAARPELAKINEGFGRNEGLRLSRAADKDWQKEKSS